MSQATAVIILAGGKSRRMRSDKRRLRLWGESGPDLLTRTVLVAQQVSQHVLVVLNDPEAWPELPAELVQDQQPASGALGGLLSGLVASPCPYALVLACDLPCLSQELLQAMINQPHDYDLLIPRSADTRNQQQLEPLHAIYHQRCIPVIQQMIASGQQQLAAIAARVQTRYLDHAFLQQYDPTGQAFLNLNTPDQVAAFPQP